MTRAAAHTVATPAAHVPVVEPRDAAGLAAVLAEANAAGRAIVPRGGGTKADWGQPPRAANPVLSTRHLDRVLEHAAGDMTVTVEAGCTIASLQRALAPRGQRLALDPLWADRATVGGVLAANDGGSLRAGYGSLRDLVLGVTVALADGTLARSGGKVVKNVAGYDLPKLMVGSMGTLGVITQATFRLHPLPAATHTLSFTTPDADAAQRLVLALQHSGPPLTGLQVVVAPGEPCRVDVRLEGSPAGVEASAVAVGHIGTACGAGVSVGADVADPWRESERLWTRSGPVVKATFLPTGLAALCGSRGGQACSWVVQGVGVGLAAVPDGDGGGADQITELADQARAAGGSLVVLRGTVELKRSFDPLEHSGALPLMRRVKQQFDPAGTLNPGRLGGGI